jgi:hypothetical protein
MKRSYLSFALVAILLLCGSVNAQCPGSLGGSYQSSFSSQYANPFVQTFTTGIGGTATIIQPPLFTNSILLSSPFVGVSPFVNVNVGGFGGRFGGREVIRQRTSIRGRR